MREHGFSGAGFSHQRDDLAHANRQFEALDGLDHVRVGREPDMQVFDLQEWRDFRRSHGKMGYGRSRRCSRRCRPAEIRRPVHSRVIPSSGIDFH